jgi:DNA-binding response OmpR family regulator
MAEKVLVVDDEPESLKLFGYALHRQGYEVFVAQSGEEALESIRKYRPDLVILDIMMPGMDGFEVCRQIRADPEVQHVPVMMLTAKSGTEDKVAGFESGADDYLSKPVALAELFARVKVLLARSRAAAPTPVVSSARAKIIAFLGVKGGVGTTTLAVNIAIALQGKTRSVVLAELRPSQGMAGAMLKLSSPNHLGKLATKDPKTLTRQAVQEAMVSHFSGLGVLLAPQVVIGEDARPIALDASRTQAVLSALQGAADYVVLDLGTGLRESTLAALRQSQRTVLVSEHCPLSLRLCRQTLAAITSLGLTGNRVDVVVNNRSRQNVTLSLTEMEKLVGQPILGIVLPMTELLFRANSEEEGRPVAMLPPDTPGLRTLADLADALTKG